MYEVACEPNNNCDTDQQSFKAYLSRWMAATTKVAPWTSDQLMPYLQASASAAAQSCSGGADGVTCGTKWYVAGWDNTYGVGQQMNALEVIQSNLIQQVQGPLSNKTGGTSQGNPSAGTGGDMSPGAPTGQITTGDKAGAGILTALILVLILGGAWYVDATTSSINELLLTFAGGWWHRLDSEAITRGIVKGAFGLYGTLHDHFATTTRQYWDKMRQYTHFVRRRRSRHACVKTSIVFKVTDTVKFRLAGEWTSSCFIREYRCCGTRLSQPTTYAIAVRLLV